MRFIDSCRFIASSLHKMASSFDDDRIKNLKVFYIGDEVLRLWDVKVYYYITFTHHHLDQIHYYLPNHLNLWFKHLNICCIHLHSHQVLTEFSVILVVRLYYKLEVFVCYQTQVFVVVNFLYCLAKNVVVHRCPRSYLSTVLIFIFSII